MNGFRVGPPRTAVRGSLDGRVDVPEHLSAGVSYNGASGADLAVGGLQSRRRDNFRDNRAESAVRAEKLESASPCATISSVR